METKKKNRILNCSFAGLFIVSIATIGFFSFRLIKNYRENLALRELMEAIIADHEQTGSQDDGYYTVFVEDHYVAFDGGKVIVTFPTSK